MQVRAAEVIATVYGTILSGTTEELLMLSTAQGKMEIKLDSNTDASACKILLPGREIYVDVTYGSDAYLHAAKITNSTPVDASTIDYSSTVTVTGEIDDKTREDILYLDTPQGEMQIKLDATTNMNGVTVLVAGKEYQVTCARGSDVLHLVYHQTLSVLASRHSVRRVLSPCVFQTVLLSCAISAFGYARSFDVLHLVHHPSLNVLALRHSVRRVLSPCVFQTVLLSCAMTAVRDAAALSV